jgi:hypothetical protein
MPGRVARPSAAAGGDLFGLEVLPGDRGLLFVDDGDNTVKRFGR